MFEFISKIALNLGVPLILLNNELFFQMFSSWYFHTFHYWEYIDPDYSFIENEEDSSSSEDDYSFYKNEDNSSLSENDCLCNKQYISDTGSDYDMHDFESYYYEYVFTIFY